MPSPIFDIQAALQLGQFVQAAYELFSAGDPPDFIPPAGYTLVTKVYADDITDDVPDFRVFGYIARSASPNSDVIVAIRGTEGVLEWIRNFEFVQVPFPFVSSAGKTEQGFTGFYSTFHAGPDNTTPRVLDVIRALVADGSVATLRISGHSLGAALATLLAIDVAGNQVFANPSVYTFAGPRVGDKVFAGTFDQFVADSWRIVNLHDIVPHLPSAFAGYVHVDAEYPINSDDTSRHSFVCWHSLQTYLHTLDNTQPLDLACVP
jgi:predicted lipase